MSWYVRAAQFYVYGKKHFTKAGYEQIQDKALEFPSSPLNIVITGGNSGIGYGVVQQMYERGDNVFMLVRSMDRGNAAKEKILEEASASAGVGRISIHLCDVSSQSSIRQFVDEFECDQVDVLIHNAGVMLNDGREETEDGIEKTLATNSLSNVLLTELMLPKMKPNGRVIFVASGGALTEKLLWGDDYNSQKYDGQAFYARTKRHQVALAHIYADRLSALQPERHLSFFSCHPGWVDTTAVRNGMPGFYEKMKDEMRSVPQGADVICWLSCTAAPLQNGAFYRDRQVEIEHVGWFAGTRYTPEQANAFYHWAREQVGIPYDKQ